MRNPNFRFVGLWARQYGGGVGGGAVGDVKVTATAPTAGTWQDMTIPVAPYQMSAFPALVAAHGPLNGSIVSNPQNATVAAYSQQFSAAWAGNVYGCDGAVVRKKTVAFGPYGGNLVGAAGGTMMNLFPFTGPAGPAGSSRLFIGGIDGAGTSGFLNTMSSDAANTGNVNVGNDGTNPYIPWLAFDTGVANTFIALVHAGAATPGAPIFRTTNAGAAWTQITSTLSTPAVRLWCGIWKSGANIWMIGQAMAFAVSSDNGVTWAVNSAPPNAGAMWFPQGVAQFKRVPPVAFDWTARKGYTVDISGGGRLLSWDLDNPNAGFTTVLGAGAFANGTAGFWSYTAAGMWSGRVYNDAIKPGIWFASFAEPTVWRQVFALPLIPAVGRPNPTIDGAIPSPVEAFGSVIFDNGPGAGAVFPANWTTPDMVTFSDRWTVLNPGFTQGRKPYLRVA